ncbi:hypothetical protein SKAU_G00376100 [Synaphobranchus kaupii]|uniref:Uncharacterized protein n=1 Tax=Synaphobranchus kaupii TaxID=118154 RepID=A0A9Q1IDC9_SYNKA|nr:hypothetical protein SKAU_G00376100 [Synaphobranchus kaupii]
MDPWAPKEKVPPRSTNPSSDAAMKFSLAVLVVVLALAIGNESVSVVKREAPELEQITKYFQELSATLTRTTQEMVEKLKAHELAGQAQTYFEDGKAQLQPLAEKIQEQLKPLAANIEQQLKPLTESMQAQIKPLAESVQAQLEDLWKKVLDQTKALAPPPSQ